MGATAAVLYRAARVGLKHNPILRTCYARFCAAGNVFKVAITACMRKLLTILTGASAAGDHRCARTSSRSTAGSRNRDVSLLGPNSWFQRAT